MFDGSAILDRIREVAEQGSGSLRTIASDRFSGSYHDGLDENAKASRALVAPRIEPSFSNFEVHPASPSVVGSLRLYNVEIEIKVIRHFDPDEKFDDAKRDSIKSLSIEDADVLAQSLEHLGNMKETEGGTATNLISNKLRYVGSTPVTLRLGDNQRNFLETRHTFEGVVKVSMST